MTRSQIDELLMAINSLVDNAQHWSSRDTEQHAQAIQRMAANLPRLVRERDELRNVLQDAYRATLPAGTVRASSLENLAANRGWRFDEERGLVPS